MLRVFTAFVFLSSITACGGGPKPSTYADHARYAYEQGLEALNDANYLEATEFFSSVKTKYPYSQYAALAEVRIGDTYFEQDQFVEAVGAYRTFIRRRPNHAEVGYAMWRIGESFFEQRPSEFFLLPPGYERDRSTTKDAVRAYRAFLLKFPKHKSALAASKKLKTCRENLADFELYVAGFYLRNERIRSAMGRLEDVVLNFDDVPSRWRKASLLLLDAYLTLGKAGSDGQIELKDGHIKARALVERISKKFPNTKFSRDAQQRLSRL
ncbi:MAG: outer membrane protein assembly factor BamD [Myxococcota bacterium]|nr:outer membrane protein assembly factor BamD [Myxococcota bacterium]